MSILQQLIKQLAKKQPGWPVALNKPVKRSSDGGPSDKADVSKSSDKIKSPPPSAKSGEDKNFFFHESGWSFDLIYVNFICDFRFQLT